MAFSNNTPQPRPNNFGQAVQSQTLYVENNSGQGPNTPVPDVVARRFNWGACLLGCIWALGNEAPRIAGIIFCVGFLSRVPHVGGLITLGFSIFCGIKGNTWAWQHKRFQSVEHFHGYQRKWAVAGVIFMLFIMLLLTVFFHYYAKSMLKINNMFKETTREHYMARIASQVKMYEKNGYKYNLSSNGLALCFVDAFPGTERIGNSINANTDGVILTFEGNGSCRQEGDCKVIYQMDKNKLKDTFELPLYANDNGYMYIKDEDYRKIHENTK